MKEERTGSARPDRRGGREGGCYKRKEQDEGRGERGKGWEMGVTY